MFDMMNAGVFQHGEERNDSAKYTGESHVPWDELNSAVMYEVHARNLAQLYLDIEEAIVPTDRVNIRPREMPKDMQRSFAALLKSLDKHFLLEKNSFRNRMRNYLRLWCAKSPGFMGFTD